MRWREIHYSWLVGLSLSLVLGGFWLTVPMAEAAIDGSGGQFSPTIIQTEGQPGQTISGSIRWTNLANRTELLHLSLADLTTTEEGYLEIAPAGSSKYSLAQWVVLAQTTYQPNQLESVPIEYNLIIPPATVSGDYFGAITIAIDATGLIKHQVVIPIIIRVAPKPTALSDQTSVASALLGTTGQPPPTGGSLHNIELSELSGPMLNIFHPTHFLSLKNHSRVISDAQAIIEYVAQNKTVITTKTIFIPTILPQTQRRLKISSPDLIVSTAIGPLPYIGPLTVDTHLSGSVQHLKLSTFVMPWWLLVIVTLAISSLIWRILSFVPHLKIGHLILPYQGRISLTIILAILGFIPLIGQLGFTPEVMASSGTTVEHNLEVVSVSGYQIIHQGTTNIVTIQTNRPIQVNTFDHVYLIYPGDQPVTLPDDVEFMLISPVAFIAPR